MKEIVVVGSINADLVFISKTRPKAGETKSGDTFMTIPGGKGANQAVAAAKLGAEVTMLGCVGNDIYGGIMIENLQRHKIQTEHIKYCPVSTGVAGIMVDSEDNSIVVIPGANSWVDRPYINAHIKTILEAKIVILQLEIPLETVEYVIDICFEHHIMTILNPAPATKLSRKIIEKVTYITPNEHECREIFETKELEELLREYPNKLIVTQGEKGVSFHDGKAMQAVPCCRVEPLDTTGAGDTFNGAFAFGLLQEWNMIETITYANKVAALSVTKFGAQGGMPTREEVDIWEQEKFRI